MKKFTETNKVEGYSIMTDAGWAPISNLHTTIEYEVWEIELSNGKRKLRCADNHILFDINYAEVFVKDLSLGDKVQTDEGLMEVTSIYKTGKKEEMYDLEVDDENHRYFTAGILSHNTQLAKEIGKYMYGSEDDIIRVDMSEYMESFSVSKLIGSPPGYVGHEDGGQLTEKVRRKPHSLILFDEIEKAHPDIFNLLLQMLDDGRLTDSGGRLVDFRNCLIIMTSNTGSRQLEDFGKGIGFNTKTIADEAQFEKNMLMKAMTKSFAPEFLNRIDEIVIFNKLNEDDIEKILDVELNHIRKNLTEVGGYKLRINTAAKKIIIEQGYNDRYGARQMTRTLERLVENKISELILMGTVKEGDTINISAKDGEVMVK